MSKLVRGDQLPSNLRREVLSSYVYRWTSDNPQRERAWTGIKGAPTMPLVSDEQWLRDHAFYVTDRGTLDKKRKHAHPAYLIEDKSTIRTLGAGKKSPAQLDREIAEALGSTTHAAKRVKTASHARQVKYPPGDPKRYPGYAIASGTHGDDAYFRSKDAALRAAKRLANEKNRRVEVAHITKNQDRQIVDEIYPSRW